MKNLFILPILLFTYALSAQDPITIHNGCNFDGDETESEYYTFETSNEADKIVKQILDGAGSLSHNSLIVKESNVKNALATTVDKRRYILYSTAFLEKFKGDAKTKWAAYTVLAHEIGHHLNGHDFGEKNPRERKRMELEADKFAGSVCRTLGASLDQALAGIEVMKIEGETATHPAKSARKAAVANGWKRQDETLQNAQQTLESTASGSEKTNAAIPGAPSTKPVQGTAIAPDACAKCSGAGTIVNKIKCTVCDADGSVWVKETCKTCNGTKRVAALKCVECGGKSKRTLTEKCAACKGAGQNLGATCPKCSGLGWGQGMPECKDCKGSGHILSGTCQVCQGSRTFEKTIDCFKCDGTGLKRCPDSKCINGTVKIGKKPCESCNGTGRMDDRDRCSACKGSGKKKKP